MGKPACGALETGDRFELLSWLTTGGKAEIGNRIRNDSQIMDLDSLVDGGIIQLNREYRKRAHLGEMCGFV